MNEFERLESELTQNEAWLRGWATPPPDAVTLERVKAAVGPAGATDAKEALIVARALSAAKAGVRRELRRRSASLGTRVWRVGAPLGLAAAAAALAFLVFPIGNGRQSSMVPRVADVEVASGGTDGALDEFDATLSALEADLQALRAEYFSATTDPWRDVMLDEMLEASESTNTGLGQAWEPS